MSRPVNITSLFAAETPNQTTLSSTEVTPVDGEAALEVSSQPNSTADVDQAKSIPGEGNSNNHFHIKKKVLSWDAESYCRKWTQLKILQRLIVGCHSSCLMKAVKSGRRVFGYFIDLSINYPLLSLLISYPPTRSYTWCPVRGSKASMWACLCLAPWLGPNKAVCVCVCVKWVFVLRRKCDQPATETDLHETT